MFQQTAAVDRRENLLAALTSGEVIYSNALATVTPDCILLRKAGLQTVISLSAISDIKTFRITYPVCLVISGALFLLAAAAHVSKDGGGADVPMVLLAVFFLIGYLITRRASAAFVVGSELIETGQGSFTDVAAIIAAVNTARAIVLGPLVREPALSH